MGTAKILRALATSQKRARTRARRHSVLGALSFTSYQFRAGLRQPSHIAEDGAYAAPGLGLAPVRDLASERKHPLLQRLGLHQVA